MNKHKLGVRHRVLGCLGDAQEELCHRMLGFSSPDVGKSACGARREGGLGFSVGSREPGTSRSDQGGAVRKVRGGAEKPAESE